MIEILLDRYEVTILALGAMAALMLAQLLAADVIGILEKHEPGTPVKANHGDLLFRASRVVANTNESIAVFILLVLFALFAGGPPDWTGYAAWGFVIARIAYAACYYLDIRLLRSVCFGISLLALLFLGIVTLFF